VSVLFILILPYLISTATSSTMQTAHATTLRRTSTSTVCSGPRHGTISPPHCTAKIVPDHRMRGIPHSTSVPSCQDLPRSFHALKGANSWAGPLCFWMLASVVATRRGRRGRRGAGCKRMLKYGVRGAGSSGVKIAERTRVTVKAWQVDVQRPGRLTADHG
jgi:hypothetical protein